MRYNYEVGLPMLQFAWTTFVDFQEGPQAYNYDPHSALSAPNPPKALESPEIP